MEKREIESIIRAKRISQAVYEKQVQEFKKNNCPINLKHSEEMLEGIKEEIRE